MYVIKLFLLSRATSRIEDCHYGFASNLKRCCTRRRFLLDSWWRDIRDQVNGYDRCNQHTFWYRRGGMWVMFVIQYIHEEVREKIHYQLNSRFLLGIRFITISVAPLDYFYFGTLSSSCTRAGFPSLALCCPKHPKKRKHGVCFTTSNFRPRICSYMKPAR